MKHSEDSPTSHEFSQHVCSTRSVRNFFKHFDVTEVERVHLTFVITKKIVRGPYHEVIILA